jgi:hypothetical protein
MTHFDFIKQHFAPFKEASPFFSAVRLTANNSMHVHALIKNFSLSGSSDVLSRLIVSQYDT